MPSATLGLKVESRTVEDGHRSLDRLVGAAKRAERASKGLTAANDNMARAAARVSAAHKQVVADLEFERAQLARNARQRAIAINLRRAEVSAASAEGKAIASVTAALHAEEAALARRNRLKSAALGGVRGGAVLAAGLITYGSIRAFAEFEQGLVGVGKTTDITGRQLEALGADIQEISLRVPVATTELLGIAQAAGQLGVKGSENIAKFTETVAKLGGATNLQGEEAATTLARILTVTGTSISDVDRLGSTFVQLGNNFAATEREIASAATRIAQATSQFNVSAASVSGIAVALAAVGVEAEAGGTQIGLAFQAINDALRQGGEEMRLLEQVTGQTGEALREQFFNGQSVAVFRSLVEGLGRIQKSGGDVSAVLDAMGLEGVRAVQVLGTLATRSEVLADGLRQANDEWERNTALNQEAERATETLTAQMQLTKNAVSRLAVALGKEAEPSASGFLKIVRDLSNAIANNPDSLLNGINKGIPALGLFARALAQVGRASEGAQVILPVAPHASMSNAASGSIQYTPPAPNINIPSKEDEKAAAKALREQEEALNRVLAERYALIEQLQTPWQAYADTLREVNALQQQGMLLAQQAAQIQVMAGARMAGAYLDAVGSISGALTGLFQENKALGIANATINTLVGITKAFELPFPLNFAQAAAVSVAGFAQVAKIQSTSPGGGGGRSSFSASGGGGGGATRYSAPQSYSAQQPNAPQQAQGAQQVTSVHITVPERGLSREAAMELMDQFNELAADGKRLDFSVN